MAWFSNNEYTDMIVLYRVLQREVVLLQPELMQKDSLEGVIFKGEQFSNFSISSLWMAALSTEELNSHIDIFQLLRNKLLMLSEPMHP